MQPQLPSAAPNESTSANETALQELQSIIQKCALDNNWEPVMQLLYEHQTEPKKIKQQQLLSVITHFFGTKILPLVTLEILHHHIDMIRALPGEQELSELLTSYYIAELQQAGREQKISQEILFCLIESCVNKSNYDPLTLLTQKLKGKKIIIGGKIDLNSNIKSDYYLGYGCSAARLLIDRCPNLLEALLEEPNVLPLDLNARRDSLDNNENYCRLATHLIIHDQSGLIKTITKKPDPLPIASGTVDELMVCHEHTLANENKVEAVCDLVILSINQNSGNPPEVPTKKSAIQEAYNFILGKICLNNGITFPVTGKTEFNTDMIRKGVKYLTNAMGSCSAISIKAGNLIAHGLMNISANEDACQKVLPSLPKTDANLDLLKRASTKIRFHMLLILKQNLVQYAVSVKDTLRKQHLEDVLKNERGELQQLVTCCDYGSGTILELLQHSDDDPLFNLFILEILRREEVLTEKNEQLEREISLLRNQTQQASATEQNTVTTRPVCAYSFSANRYPLLANTSTNPTPTTPVPPEELAVPKAEALSQPKFE